MNLDVYSLGSEQELRDMENLKDINRYDNGKAFHVPVMSEEVLSAFAGHKGIIADATVGLGGHTSLLLDSNKDISIIAFETDTDIFNITKKFLSKHWKRVNIFNKSYTELGNVIKEHGISELNGILADFGCSSYHFDSSNRGFSMYREEFLDMRFSKSTEITAYDLINSLSEEKLCEIFWGYGEERFTKSIVRKIIRVRNQKKIYSSKELADIVASAVPRNKKQKSHPATRVFQSLRIAVNNELENIDRFIKESIPLLAIGGIFCAISFHSLEDRIVKNRFKEYALKNKNRNKYRLDNKREDLNINRDPVVELLSKKPLLPSIEEIEHNHRSRSAKMRIIKRIL